MQRIKGVIKINGVLIMNYVGWAKREKWKYILKDELKEENGRLFASEKWTLVFLRKLVRVGGIFGFLYVNK